jgi:hypothetical protein
MDAFVPPEASIHAGAISNLSRALDPSRFSVRVEVYDVSRTSLLAFFT